MTKLHQILTPSFRTIIRRQQQEWFHLYHPASMVQRCWTVNTQFCQAVVGCGYLSFEQHATPTQKAAKIDLIDFLFTI